MGIDGSKVRAAATTADDAYVEIGRLRDDLTALRNAAGKAIPFLVPRVKDLILRYSADEDEETIRVTDAVRRIEAVREVRDELAAALALPATSQEATT